MRDYKKSFVIDDIYSKNDSKLKYEIEDSLNGIFCSDTMYDEYVKLSKTNLSMDEILIKAVAAGHRYNPNQTLELAVEVRTLIDKIKEVFRTSDWYNSYNPEAFSIRIAIHNSIYDRTPYPIGYIELSGLENITISNYYKLTDDVLSTIVPINLVSKDSMELAIDILSKHKKTL